MKCCKAKSENLAHILGCQTGAVTLGRLAARGMGRCPMGSGRGWHLWFFRVASLIGGSHDALAGVVARVLPSVHGRRGGVTFGSEKQWRWFSGGCPHSVSVAMFCWRENLSSLSGAGGGNAHGDVPFLKAPSRLSPCLHRVSG